MILFVSILRLLLKSFVEVFKSELLFLFEVVISFVLESGRGVLSFTLSTTLLFMVSFTGYESSFDIISSITSFVGASIELSVVSEFLLVKLLSTVSIASERSLVLFSVLGILLVRSSVIL